jgi:Family of unknown function (DUF6460)
MDRPTVFGGSALAVVLRLAILSIVVGIVLMALGITPDNLFANIATLSRRVYDMGFGAVAWVGKPLLLGAMIVIPIWLITLLMGIGGGQSGGGGFWGRRKR